MSLLAYLFYFVAATIAPIQRRWLATKNEGGNKIDLAFKVSLVSAVSILILPVFSPFQLQGSYSSIVLLLVASAIGGACASVCYFAAQRHVEAGVTSVLANSYTPITIVLSSLFLHEGLRGLQIVGAALLISAAVVVSKKHRIGKIRYDKYFWLMILNGVFLSILIVSNRELMKITGFTASIVLTYWAVCMGLGVLAFFAKGKTTYTKKDLVITGGLKSLQDLSWGVLTFVVGNLSVVSAVTTFKIVVMFVVAALFLNEREDLTRKIFGSLVAVAGLLMMK